MGNSLFAYCATYGSEIEIIRIRTVAFAGVECGNGCHILRRQVEIENIEVLLDAFDMSGLRQYDDAALDVPTNHHLSCGLAILAPISVRTGLPSRLPPVPPSGLHASATMPLERSCPINS